MEYDFETGHEDEVMEREKQRARERYHGELGGFGDAIAPLVRIILALLTTLGVQSVREALRRIKEDNDTLVELRRSLGVMRHNYETSPMMKVAGEIAAAMGMPDAPIGEVVERARRLFAPVDVEGDVTRLVEGITQAAEAPGIAVRTWITPLVEDRARLRREVKQAHAEIECLRDAGGSAQSDAAYREHVRSELSASDHARVSLHATTAAVQSLPAPERKAYWSGVEQGRREALDRPSGFVLVLEDGLPPAEVARVAELYRSVRGVVAALPVADVALCRDEKSDPIKRLATLSVELISARAANAQLERDVDRLTKLARALRAQRAEARAGQSTLGIKLGDAQGEIAMLAAQRDNQIAAGETQETAGSYGAIDGYEEVDAALDEIFDGLGGLPRGHVELDADNAPDSVDPHDLPTDCDGCHEPVSECVCDAGRKARGEPPFPPVERLCVAVLMTDPSGRVAVIESAKEGRAWELPGGKVKAGETPRAAAVREVAEELGVQLVEDALEPAGIVYGTPKPGAAFASVIHVFRARAEGELRPGSDAKGACWLHASAVLDLQANGRLSDLQTTHDVLLPWARETVGGAS